MGKQRIANQVGDAGRCLSWYMPHSNIDGTKSEPALILKQNIELRAVTRKRRQFSLDLIVLENGVDDRAPTSTW